MKLGFMLHNSRAISVLVNSNVNEKTMTLENDIQMCHCVKKVANIVTGH